MSASHQAMWRGLFTLGGTVREIGWLAVVEPYKAYLDETNVHDKEQWCFVAGHVGTEEQWKEYDLKWRKGLGQRKSLHMNELRWNFKPHRIKRLLETLGPIPSACKLERVFGSVRGSHYQDLVPKIPGMGAEHFDPFMFAIWPCIVQTLRWLPRKERVIFTFENNGTYGPLLSFVENSMRRIPLALTPSGERRAILVPVPKGFTPRTEAADYLAFELGQEQIDKNSYKAEAGRSILGDRHMIGKQTSRNETRTILENSLLLARAKTGFDLKRDKERARINKEIKELVLASQRRQP